MKPPLYIVELEPGVFITEDGQLVDQKNARTFSLRDARHALFYARLVKAYPRARIIPEGQE